MKQHEPDIAEAPAPVQTREQRYIYNGGSAAAQADEAPRGNRPVTRRRRSPFNVILAMVIVSLLIVLYVWNKITVNRLAVELNDLQMQYQKIESANEVLRADINRKSSLDRIGKIATEQLGMEYAKVQPIQLNLDERQMEKYEGESN
jgi:cell division protein FtsL